MNTDINANYIHHVTAQEIQEAVHHLLTGEFPPRLTRPASKERYRRRWRGARVVLNEDGTASLFIGDREVIPTDRIEEVLAALYDDPVTGGNLGRDKFYARVHALYAGITRADVERFVSNDETHQLLRRVVNRMKVVRPLPVPEGRGIRWQMDLIDMGERFQHDNLGYRYVLTVIDTFTKYAWAVPLKTKDAAGIVEAMEGLFAEEGPPAVLQSDNGTEFKNAEMAALAEEHGVRQVFGAPYRPQSQGCVERFNQTLKRFLWGHMTRYNTNVWADVLPLLVDNYNHVIHDSTGIAPADLEEAPQDSEAAGKAGAMMRERNRRWLKKYGKPFKEIRVGDPVRVSNLVFKDYRRKGKLAFKAYKPNWSREIYTVISISHPADPSLTQPVYTVRGPTGNILRVFRDNLQLLPSFAPRVTPPAARPRVPGFFYRELQRERARAARGTIERVPVPPLVITEEARTRRRPSVLLREYYV